MKLVGKCLVVSSVAAGLFAAAQFSERKTVASWTGAPPVVESAPSRRASGTIATAAVVIPEPAKPAAAPAVLDGCAGAVWPNIPKECITGRAEPARAEARPVLRREAAVEAPAKPVIAERDPAATGSVAAATWPEVPSVAALEHAVPTPAKRRVRQARRPHPAARYAAAPQANPYAGYAGARTREPIQFRLADRGN
jgi:hypothetical protein